MRDAILYEWKLIEEDSESREGGKKWEKVQVGNVKFHQFGVSYDERNGTVGAFSSAIVEMPDGTLENVPVECIQFLRNDVTLN